MTPHLTPYAELGASQAAYPTPPVPHALHDDDVDVVDGDLTEVLSDGLPVEPAVEPELEPEPTLPLGV